MINNNDLILIITIGVLVVLILGGVAIENYYFKKNKIMKTLFRLRDENGKEYKLTIKKNPPVFGDVIKIEPIESEPKFKIPGWIAFDDYREIVYYTHRDGDYFKDDKGRMYHIDYCNIPTSQEIERHLKKICDEKYVGKKVRCLEHNKVKIVLGTYPVYLFELDKFIVLGKDNVNMDCNVALYEQGKWADIVPDKKPLPKTRREFRNFLNDYGCNHKYEEPNDFLENYED